MKIKTNCILKQELESKKKEEMIIWLFKTVDFVWMLQSKMLNSKLAHSIKIGKIEETYYKQVILLNLMLFLFPEHESRRGKHPHL